MGTPKALVRTAAGEPWLTRAVDVLVAGSCVRVTVVLGAAADEARALLTEPEVQVVVAEDWEAGMSASLRSGLAAIAQAPDTPEATHTDAVVVTLVDLPDLTAAVVRRVVAAGASPATLARATYDGSPGHPVLIGRDHWAGVLAGTHGDVGARDYLATHPVTTVECGDLATGRDQDTPDHHTPGHHTREPG